MTPAVKLALIAILFAGAGWPFLKVSQQAGVSASWILILNGFSSAFIGLISLVFFDYSKRPPTVGVLIAIATLLILNTSFFLTNYSLSLRGGQVSIIYAISPAATLIAILIGLLFLKESGSVIVLKLIFGALLILTGSYFVSTSIK